MKFLILALLLVTACAFTEAKSYGKGDSAFSANISCDMKTRYPGNCPTNHCCVIEILPVSGPFCRPLAVAGKTCTTTENNFFCPCAPGMKCVAKKRKDGSTSIYGKCT